MIPEIDIRRERMDDFDYIVIGAGSARCALASRPTEDSKSGVLLLEFGGSDRSMLIRMRRAVDSEYAKVRLGFCQRAGATFGRAAACHVARQGAEGS